MSTTCICVFADSLYFGKLIINNGNTPLSISDLNIQFMASINWSSISINGTTVITPLNNFLYNTKTENLSLHGLHPWYHHLLANIPMLFGPLILILAYILIQKLMNKKSARQMDEENYLLGILLWSIFVLSLAPHQEARFLLPLSIPLILVTSYYLINSSILFWIWVLFNCLLALFFGVIHQGGVIPASTHIQSLHCNDNSTITLITYHTYMSPSFPLCDNNEKYEVINLGGKEDYILIQTIQETLAKSDFIYVIMPSSTSLKKLGPVKYQLIYSAWPHLSTEHFPEKFTLQNFKLNVYKIKNK